jgi:hypothetical protein
VPSSACPECGAALVGGCEYPYGPNHYDGVSEWRYACGHRIGRWTGKVLAEGEAELPFGGKMAEEGGSNP